MIDYQSKYFDAYSKYIVGKLNDSALNEVFDILNETIGHPMSQKLWFDRGVQLKDSIIESWLDAMKNDMEVKTLEINTLLATRDGRLIGNAIVTNIENDFYLVKTDYGNESKFTIDDINSLFYIVEKEHISDYPPHKHAVTL